LAPTIRAFVVLFLFVLIRTVSADAQAISGSIYYGGGTAFDSSIGSINTLGGGTVYSTPSLGGYFNTIGGDVMFFRHQSLGVGVEASFRNGNAPYAGLLYHPSFYDVNAIYHRPLFSSRLIAEFQGGGGRATVNLYYTPQFCQSYPEGCRSSTAAVTGENYTEWHGAAGIRYYVYKGVFVRPQFDIRKAGNFNNYFSSSWIPEVSVAIGYTLSHKLK
jgi:hypothetical protein